MVWDDAAGFWWENITGPQMLAEEIAASLSDGKNVVLRTDGSLPWGEQLRDFVAHRLEQVQLRTLDWMSGGTQDAVIPALLKHLCRSGLSVCPPGYREQLAYVKNERIFADTVVWLLRGDSGDLSTLLHFLSNYRGKGLEQHGAFVAEISAEQNLPRMSEETAVLDCTGYIRPGDLLLYASILAEGARTLPPELTGYAACVTAALAGQNAELIPEILREIDFQRDDPAETLNRLWNEGRIFCPAGSPGEEELRMRVWKAQLQSVFALIEMERFRITDVYEEDIREAMACEYWDPMEADPKKQTGYIHQRRDKLEDASDLELGTLNWMLRLRCNDDRTEPLWYLPEEDVRDWIRFLTGCRNSLAHHRVCSPEQMCRLLRAGR